LCLTPAFHVMHEAGLRVGLECTRVIAVQDTLWGNDDVAVVAEPGMLTGPVTDVENALWDYEREHLPDVRMSRPAMFLQALGLSGMAPMRVCLHPRAVDFAEDAKVAAGMTRLPWVFVQTEASEPYKECPPEVGAGLIEALLAAGYLVLTISRVSAATVAGAGHTDIQVGSPQQALALFNLCEAGIGYDSFYLHAAAALEKPFVAILGPTTCVGRVVDYPLARALSIDCDSACFRNSEQPCKRLGAVSYCLAATQSEPVLRTLEEVLRCQTKSRTAYIGGTNDSTEAECPMAPTPRLCTPLSKAI